MKVKVDKDEYEELLERVKTLENRTDKLLDNWMWTREGLYMMMEEYFHTKCMTVMVKRDKDKVIAEVRKKAMDNIFKEEE